MYSREVGLITGLQEVMVPRKQFYDSNQHYRLFAAREQWRREVRNNLYVYGAFAFLWKRFNTANCAVADSRHRFLSSGIDILNDRFLSSSWATFSRVVSTIKRWFVFESFRHLQISKEEKRKRQKHYKSIFLCKQHNKKLTVTCCQKRPYRIKVSIGNL